LFHDNALPHSAAATLGAIRQWKFEILPPHVIKSESPTKYHMFGQLKKHCEDEDWPVMISIRSQPKIFFADEIRRLANRYTKRVKKKGG